LTKQIGIVSLTRRSIIENDPLVPAMQRLSRWLASPEGCTAIERTRRLVSARLPLKPSLRTNYSSVLGYLVEFRVIESKQLMLTVDDGSERLIYLNFPLSLLESIRLESPCDVILSPSEERRLSQLSKLGKVFRPRCLLHITVVRLEEQILGWEQCTHQIVDMSIPNQAAMTAWYANILRSRH
jgi:hypothetical protein